MPAKRRAAKKPSALDITGVPAILAGLIILAAAWPVVLLHGNARWIGEGLWVGIPCFAVASVLGVSLWKERDERKLKRLRNRRLWAEGKHPTQLHAKQALEAELRRQAAERQRLAEIEAAQRQRQQIEAAHKAAIKDGIRREKERLRELRAARRQAGNLVSSEL